jgi:hypothetical protein
MDCVPAQDLTWWDWYSSSSEELRSARCLEYLAAQRQSYTIPNPALVLTKFVSLLVVEPVCVFIDSVMHVYFYMVVEFGAAVVWPVLVVLVLWIVYMIRRTHQHVYHQTATITDVEKDLERGYVCDFGDSGQAKPSIVYQLLEDYTEARRRRGWRPPAILTREQQEEQLILNC